MSEVCIRYPVAPGDLRPRGRPEIFIEGHPPVGVEVLNI
jgi:hypothetical protein